MRIVGGRWPGILSAVAVCVSAQAAQPQKSLTMYYADPTAPDISGLWRPERTPGFGVWLVDGKPLPGRDQQGTWLEIPYTPVYLELYHQRQQMSLAGTPYGDPHFNCWPRGPVSAYLSGDATMVITQTPGRVQQIFREDTQLVEFYTDGRPIPLAADPSNDDYAPRMNGYSIGHWEGKTLVTETRGIRKELTLGFLAPHSDVTDVFERIARADQTHLHVDIRVVDAKALTKPMQTHVDYTLDPTGSLEDEFCAENNRNATGPDGFVTTEVRSKRSTTFDLPDN